MAPWVLSLPTVVYVVCRRRLRVCIVLVSFACHDGCVDDLQRILGYTDAIDESAPITKVADELFVMSCWTPQFCTALIRAAEAAGGFSAQPGDPVPGHEISLALISPRLTFTAGAIADSTANNVTITSSAFNNGTMDTVVGTQVTLTSSALNDSTAANTIITSSQFNNGTANAVIMTSSEFNDGTGNNVTLTSSTIDDSLITNSIISDSTFTGSMENVVSTNMTIKSGTADGLGANNSTFANGTLAGSVFDGGTINKSTLADF